MKKKFLPVVIAAACLTLLYGCGDADANAPDGDTPTPTPVVTPSPPAPNDNNQIIIAAITEDLADNFEPITLGTPIANPDVEITHPSDMLYFIKIDEIVENFENFEGQTVIVTGVFHEHGGYGGFETIFRSVVRNDLSC